VANAILDGTDAVMLSAETAIGAHAVAAVRVLHDVITATESQYPNRAGLERRDAGKTWSSEPDAISFLACRLSRDVQAKAIVAPAESGRMALRIARFGPAVPIIALCESEHQARQLALAWGVVPLVTPGTGIQAARSKLLQWGWAHEDDLAVLVADSRLDPSRESHSVQVVRI
jgi:pyruvate kinase